MFAQTRGVEPFSRSDQPFERQSRLHLEWTVWIGVVIKGRIFLDTNHKMSLFLHTAFAKRSL